MENVDIHENICQCLNQSLGFAPKACKKKMVHRRTKRSNFKHQGRSEDSQMH